MGSINTCSILLVDDTEENIDILVEALGDLYDVRVAMDGPTALRAIEDEHPDLVVLDVVMPGMSGYEVCEQLKSVRTTHDIPVIFLTAASGPEEEAKGLGLGAIDYIAKPINAELVKCRVRNHLELKLHKDRLEELVARQVQEISNAQMSTIFAMSKLSESRDEDTGKHLERVQSYCKALAERLAQESPYNSTIDPAYVDTLFQASPLHDIGKVAIPDKILLKPGRLTPDEFEIMKSHTVHGAETLSAVTARHPNNDFLNMGVNIARSHHERWNGKGYPDGLSGGDIPLSARIVAVADVYDALRSERCYKKGFSHDETMAIITKERGEQFEPGIVDVLVEIQDIFQHILETMRG